VSQGFFHSETNGARFCVPALFGALVIPAAAIAQGASPAVTSSPMPIRSCWTCRRTRHAFIRLLDIGRGEAWLNDVGFGVVTDEVQQPIPSFTFTLSATAKLEVLRAFPDLDGE
jgi:hypothetical protein